MQASRALKIRGMKPEYIVITRYVSKPSISINARQMHFGRKIQVSKTHRFLEPNQIKKKKGAKEEDFYLTFKMKGMVTHTSNRRVVDTEYGQFCQAAFTLS